MSKPYDNMTKSESVLKLIELIRELSPEEATDVSLFVKNLKEERRQSQISANLSV